MLTKAWNPSASDPRVETFVELFLVTLLLQPHCAPEMSDHEARLERLFRGLGEAPELALGLQKFIRRVVSKSRPGDGHGGDLKLLCRIADKILNGFKAP